MKRILFAIFSVIVMLPMASVAATPALDCLMVNGECPTGCGYSELTHDCVKCPTGTYGPGGISACLKCNKPASANFTDNNGGMATDACPWTISCSPGFYFDEANLQCVPCGQHYNAKDNTTCTISGTGENSIPSYDGKCTLADRCDGKVYELELKKNTGFTSLIVNGESVIYKTHTAYVKYGTGFAADKNPDKWSPRQLPPDVLQPNRPVLPFNGYANTRKCDDRIFFDHTGIVSQPWSNFNGLLDGDKTLYACWDAPDITFYYYNSDQTTTWKEITWHINPEEEPQQNIALEYTSTYPSGQTFSHYLCKYGSDTPCNPDIIAAGDPIPFGEVTVNLYPVFQGCPAGHYCTNGKTNDCPAGTTSDPGAGSATNCYMVRGDGGTKFCDNTGDCFYLPGSGHVPHAKAAGN